LSTVFLGLGSNQGDRLGNLVAGLGRLGPAGLAVVAVSSVWQTEPVGGPPQPPFLNGAARFRTRLAPRAVLAAIRAAEEAAGRRRAIPHGPRPLDLDILLFGDVVIAEPDLTIPHPRLAERRFVLAPLAEIAAEAVHPVLRRSVRALLAECADSHRVEIYCKWPGPSV
jgi:2-amino-4-hydroxy-6-hydroxymethyldihydropteridine diphosphokinase